MDLHKTFGSSWGTHPDSPHTPSRADSPRPGSGAAPSAAASGSRQSTPPRQELRDDPLSIFLSLRQRDPSVPRGDIQPAASHHDTKDGPGRPATPTPLRANTPASGPSSRASSSPSTPLASLARRLSIHGESPKDAAPGPAADESMDGAQALGATDLREAQRAFREAKDAGIDRLGGRALRRLIAQQDAKRGREASPVAGDSPSTRVRYFALATAAGGSDMSPVVRDALFDAVQDHADPQDPGSLDHLHDAAIGLGASLFSEEIREADVRALAGRGMDDAVDPDIADALATSLGRSLGVAGVLQREPRRFDALMGVATEVMDVRALSCLAHGLVSAQGEPPIAAAQDLLVNALAGGLGQASAEGRQQLFVSVVQRLAATSREGSAVAQALVSLSAQAARLPQEALGSVARDLAGLAGSPQRYGQALATAAREGAATWCTLPSAGFTALVEALFAPAVAGALQDPGADVIAAVRVLITAARQAPPGSLQALGLGLARAAAAASPARPSPVEAWIRQAASSDEKVRSSEQALQALLAGAALVGGLPAASERAAQLLALCREHLDPIPLPLRAAVRDQLVEGLKSLYPLSPLAGDAPPQAS